MKNLPLGISTLSAIRGENMVYVDKTEMAWRLVKQTGRYFLSRPRRFGKSLLVDTLQQIFEGNQALFEGLFIYDHWDWSKKYPVIKIDFSGGTLQSRAQLDQKIEGILLKRAEQFGILLELPDIPGRFGELIAGVCNVFGHGAVVLVDEYDKPILDNIDRPEIAAQMREGVKNLYSVLKEQDAHLRFVFMTGVSKFSKVSLFSGINQLTDLTISKRFSTICGYTQNDLKREFAEHLQGVDWDQLQQWYNGYKWMGDEAVYNPYNILMFINDGMPYRNYWFETGNPSFLIRLFQKNRYFLPDLAQLHVTEEILDSFDVERINPLTLLFQTGYLTIDHTFTRRQRLMFAMRLPNLEVKIALHDQFINGYTGLDNEKIRLQDDLYDCLEQGDIEGLQAVIRRLFAGIPYRNFTHADLPAMEGYYASVLYAFFASLDAHIIAEDVTNHGQVDLTVMLGRHIYVIEIKVVDKTEPAGNLALDQIRKKNYAEKYRGRPGMQVHELGLVFSRRTRNLVEK